MNENDEEAEIAPDVSLDATVHGKKTATAATASSTRYEIAGNAELDLVERVRERGSDASKRIVGTIDCTVDCIIVARGFGRCWRLGRCLGHGFPRFRRRGGFFGGGKVFLRLLLLLRRGGRTLLLLLRRLRQQRFALHDL